MERRSARDVGDQNGGQLPGRPLRCACGGEGGSELEQ